MTFDRGPRTIIQRARERYPDPRPRIIPDNGPSFVAKDFMEFVRLCGMTDVRTSPNYQQSNGRLERWHRSLKAECIRPNKLRTLDHARRLIEGYGRHYDEVRLHSAIGNVAQDGRKRGHELRGAGP